MISYDDAAAVAAAVAADESMICMLIIKITFH
jgi:hypothetical protein